jgi:predicted DNA-binding protein (MmcQ/YjbR family)
MATKKKSGSGAAREKILEELRAFGLTYPGAHLKSPWPNHKDLAVNDKTFAYLSVSASPLGISCKLPSSSNVALLLPFVKPTGYGLGKSGWVSAEIGPEDDIDVEMLKEWIDESYRAQAPKKLVAQLDGGKPAAAPVKKKAAAKKKTAAPKKKRG